MLTTFIVVLAGALVFGAGEAVRRQCRRMLGSPVSAGRGRAGDGVRRPGEDRVAGPDIALAPEASAA